MKLSHSFTRAVTLRLRKLLTVGGFAFLVLFIVGCDSTKMSDERAETAAVSLRITDLPADPFVGFVEGRPVGTGRYTFFSLGESEVVSSADSATTRWDIAFQGTNILINGGTSGPGLGAAQVLDGIFEEILEAPITDWSVDGEIGPAILPGSGNGWYNYNPVAQVITPIPGRILLIKTAGAKYAKIRIVSYYQGAPETPTAESTARYLTFDFVLQPNGGRSFELDP
ncbi:MAG: HmuY family protein [Rhodothermia bacterium]|nr:MAG: HmuY family protein [Rhodothermia bacterium]